MNKNTLIIPLIFLSLPCLAENAVVVRAHYECGPNDVNYVDFDLHSNNQFSITIDPLESNFDGDAGESEDNGKTTVTYLGTYTEGPNTYDLAFPTLVHAEIEALFIHTTAGGFIKNSDVYSINKETNDGLNKVYLAGCLLERKTPQ